MDISKLREMYRYDPSSPSGVAANADRPRGRVREGDPVMLTKARRKKRLCYTGIVFGKFCYAHRIVYAIVHGEFPETVDHIDGDPLNNRIENLRAATIQQQQWNKPARKGTSSGVKGVQYRPDRSSGYPYFARIQGVHIGSFATLEEATAAYNKESQRRYGAFHNNLCTQ